MILILLLLAPLVEAGLMTDAASLAALALLDRRRLADDPSATGYTR